MLNCPEDGCHQQGVVLLRSNFDRGREVGRTPEVGVCDRHIVPILVRNASHIVCDLCKSSNASDGLPVLVKLYHGLIWVRNFGQVQRQDVLLGELVHDQHVEVVTLLCILVIWSEVQAKHLVILLDQNVG
jgi:hypothetical protein